MQKCQYAAYQQIYRPAIWKVFSKSLQSRIVGVHSYSIILDHHRYVYVEFHNGLLKVTFALLRSWFLCSLLVLLHTVFCCCSC